MPGGWTVTRNDVAPIHTFTASEDGWLVNIPLDALGSVAEKIGAVGDRVGQEERQKVGDDIPATARRPDRRVAKGNEIVDGVRLELQRLNGAETEDALTIALPDAGAIIVQDLVYNQAHPFLGERRFDSWRAALRAYQALPYEVVLPGHCLPGAKALYQEMLRYLDVAEEALDVTRSPSKFRERMIGRFPNYGGLKVLDHQLRFLFPETAHG